MYDAWKSKKSDYKRKHATIDDTHDNVDSNLVPREKKCRITVTSSAPATEAAAGSAASRKQHADEHATVSKLVSKLESKLEFFANQAKCHQKNAKDAAIVLNQMTIAFNAAKTHAADADTLRTVADQYVTRMYLDVITSGTVGGVMDSARAGFARMLSTLETDPMAKAMDRAKTNMDAAVYLLLPDDMQHQEPNDPLVDRLQDALMNACHTRTWIVGKCGSQAVIDCAECKDARSKSCHADEWTEDFVMCRRCWPADTNKRPTCRGCGSREFAAGKYVVWGGRVGRLSEGKTSAYQMTDAWFGPGNPAYHNRHMGGSDPTAWSHAEPDVCSRCAATISYTLRREFLTKHPNHAISFQGGALRPSGIMERLRLRVKRRVGLLPGTAGNLGVNLDRVPDLVAMIRANVHESKQRDLFFGRAQHRPRPASGGKYKMDDGENASSDDEPLVEENEEGTRLNAAAVARNRHRLLVRAGLLDSSSSSST